MIAILRTSLVFAAIGAALAQLPAPVNDLMKVSSSSGSVRYKEPGLCETVEGVKSYSGYIDIAEDKHLFFWFFESRNDPATDPITLWLNGGPGSDALFGLFDELGPCFIDKNLETVYVYNPYSWTNVSNVLFLSQPVGVGLSYATKEEVDLDLAELGFGNGTVRARYPAVDYTKINSTEVAAIDAWAAIQQFYTSLPQIDPAIQSYTLHLATESYGGHWGPTFFNYFRQHNAESEVQLDLGTLIIINGLIDYKAQAPGLVRFATDNTHGLVVNSTIAEHMDFILNMDGGCLAQIEVCHATESLGDTSFLDDFTCNVASTLCRNGVELIYPTYSPFKGVYDIRDPAVVPQPAQAWPNWLQIADVQQAIGVDLNYSAPSNTELLTQFWFTGDFTRSRFLKDVGELLDNGIRVELVYGDADYVANWYGGEDMSLSTNHSAAEGFRQAGYTQLIVDGQHLGDVRQHGNFSFTRVFDAGHMVPWYQPKASFAIFNRTLAGFDIARGEQMVDDGYSTQGEARSTYSQKEERVKARLRRSAKLRA